MSRTSVSTAVRSSLRRLAALGALALVALLPSNGAAQVTTGSIRGYVRDESGAALSEVQIVARNVDMGVSRSATTNQLGFYNIAGLRPGQYELTTRRIGFSAQTQRVTVLIGATLGADFRLALSATQLAAVTVTAERDVRTSEIGTNVSRAQIENLPNFERNFLDLAKLAPGMTASNVNSTDKTFAAGGQPAEAVNVFIDGASYKNDVLRGGVAGQDASKGNPFPQGAVQEFRVLTQNYKAEYQKAASAIITATTRTGGREWQGDMFAYGIGKSYVAKDANAVSRGLSKPNYKRLQAGGNLGGPLVQDKLFFFGTYEMNLRDEPSYVTLGSAAASAPASLNLQQYAGQFTQEFREHLGFGKLTWAKSERSTVEGSFNLRKDSDFRGFGGQTAYTAAENMDVRTYNGVVNWKYAGDRWLNEAQVNLQRFIWNPSPKNPGDIGLEYRDVVRIGGKDTRQKFTQDRISLRNDVTRSGMQLAGDHVFKSGVSVDFLSYESIKDFNYNPIFRLQASDNFARPYEASFGFGDSRIGTNNVQIGAYLQDDWSPTQKLTFNLGLRWDVETNMINNGYVTPQALRDSLTGPLASQFYVEKPTLRADGTCCGTPQRVNVIQQLGGFDRYLTSGRSDRPIYLKAWQPRVGASYDINGDGRSVIFGGVGLYYDRNYWNTLLDERFRRQYKVLTARFNDAGPTPACPGCVAWNNRFYDPAQLRTLSGTSALPEVFLVANDLKPPKTYQFSGGLRQRVASAQLSVSYNGIRGFNYMNYVRATPWGGLGPNYAQAFIADDRVKTWYDAVQFQIERPISRTTRWGGSLAYTLGRSEEQGQSTEIFWDFSDQHPTVSDMPRRRAPGDQRHNFVANGVVRLPYDVLFSTIVNLGSGISVNAVDASGGFGYGNEVSYVFTPPGRPFLGLGHPFANQNADLRLQKDLRVRSGQNIGVLVDLFNAFNSANRGCYRTLIKPPGDPNTDVGISDCAALGRRLQVGLRYGYRPANGGDQ